MTFFRFMLILVAVAGVNLGMALTVLGPLVEAIAFIGFGFCVGFGVCASTEEAIRRSSQ